MEDSGSQHDSDVSLDFVTVPENSEERRSFLQTRIASFARTLAIISSVFLAASASSYFILHPHPSLAERLSLDRYDLLAIALWVLLWIITRVGRIRRATLGIMEAGVTVAACTGYAVMVLGTTNSFNILVPMIAALSILIFRAVFIPTTPRRTMAVSAVGTLPAVVAAYLLSRKVNASTSIPDALGPTVYVACWAGMTVALSTVSSRIIHGLEQRVRAARKLGQYTLEERIGQGGMGYVYRAHHAMLRRPTAVKVLPPDKMGKQNIQRFEREVQLTSQLTHPNTVCIYDYGRTPDGLFYYAMEYLEGFTLTELVQTAGPLPPSRIAWILRQIAGSLAEAHAVGLIHRDVKPDNVIVCDRGGLCDLAKVLDFGLVKEFQSPEPAVSTADAVIGTPLYMSPEAFRAPASVGVASDLYCLGAVAYYLATGRHVFEASSFVEISSHHLMTAPEPPSQRRGSPLPEKLERLILACLEKDPADRPRSATAVELAAIEITDAEPWTQTQARGWWDHNRAVLAHLRSSRVGGASGPNRPRILRSLASPEDALAPTVSATRRPT